MPSCFCVTKLYDECYWFRLLYNIVNPETEIKIETEMTMIWKLKSATIHEKVFQNRNAIETENNL